MPYKTTDDCEIVLCKFDYEGKQYYIAKDYVGKKIICRRMKLDRFNVIHYMSEPVSADVLEVANELLRRFKENPKDYKTGFGFYHVTKIERDGERFFEVIKQNTLFDYFKLLTEYVLTPLLALFMAAAYCYHYVRSSGIMWSTTVFPTLPRNTLIIILYAVELIGAAVLYKLRSSNRHFWDFSFNAIIPLNLITAIGMAKANTVVRIAMICLAVLFVSVKVFPLVRYLIVSESPKKVKKKKAHRALSNMYVTALIFVICCIYVGRVYTFDGYTHIASTKAEYPEMQIITENYDAALKNINENKWSRLGIQERIDTLQSICDYECAYTFGCHTATVQTGYPGSEYLLGNYCTIPNTILINAEYLETESAHNLVETLLHETRHVYQNSIIDMYNNVEDVLSEDELRLSVFRYAAAMRDNSDNYKSFGNEYYTQTMEEDSRSWAEEQMLAKYDKYIYGEKSSDNSEDFLSFKILQNNLKAYFHAGRQ